MPVRVWLERRPIQRGSLELVCETSKVMSNTDDRHVWQAPKTEHVALVEANGVARLLTYTAHFE